MTGASTRGGPTGSEGRRTGPRRGAPATGWLLVSVTTAGGPASLRVTVWRKLKALGALYVQQSVCLLPDRPDVARQVRILVERVRRDGGDARVLPMQITDAAEDADLRAQLSAARDHEYGEVLSRLPSFFAELETEIAKGRTTFEEVEESEADLARFHAWMGKIAARDYFAAPLGELARAELRRAEHALETFTDAALAAEAQAPATRPRVAGKATGRALRALDG